MVNVTSRSEIKPAMYAFTFSLNVPVYLLIDKGYMSYLIGKPNHLDYFTSADPYGSCITVLTVYWWF